MKLTHEIVYALKSKKLIRKKFFEIAQKCGLEKDGNYISGIPSGNDIDINNFYLLEDILDYPQPQKIPKTYLLK